MCSSLLVTLTGLVAAAPAPAACNGRAPLCVFSTSQTKKDRLVLIATVVERFSSHELVFLGCIQLKIAALQREAY
jgi:hypothetical protein